MLFFCYLCKAEFQLCLPAEDDDNHLQFASVFQNLIDRAAEAAERAVRDADALADFVIHDGFRRAVDVFILRTENALRLFFAKGTAAKLPNINIAFKQPPPNDVLLFFRLSRLSLFF